MDLFAFNCLLAFPRGAGFFFVAHQARALFVQFSIEHAPLAVKLASRPTAGNLTFDQQRQLGTPNEKSFAVLIRENTELFFAVSNYFTNRIQCPINWPPPQIMSLEFRRESNDPLGTLAAAQFYGWISAVKCKPQSWPQSANAEKFQPVTDSPIERQHIIHLSILESFWVRALLGYPYWFEGLPRSHSEAKQPTR